MESVFKRILIVVLDGVGIGAMPDADQWGDAGSDTLGHVIAAERPELRRDLRHPGNPSVL